MLVLLCILSRDILQIKANQFDSSKPSIISGVTNREDKRVKYLIKLKLIHSHSYANGNLLPNSNSIMYTALMHYKKTSRHNSIDLSILSMTMDILYILHIQTHIHTHTTHTHISKIDPQKRIVK